MADLHEEEVRRARPDLLDQGVPAQRVGDALTLLADQGDALRRLLELVGLIRTSQRMLDELL